MVIFDFDGVLINSLNEVTITSYNALTDELKLSLQELPSGFAELFQQNRFHLQPAGDFITLARWCLENCSVTPNALLTRDDFFSILNTETQALSTRSEKFFRTRHSYISRHRSEWLSLHEPYEIIWQGIDKLQTDELIILTNKNREAVLELCSHFALKVLPKNIYSGDGSGTKNENFRKITKRFDSKHYYFIDDSVRNLIDLRKHIAPSLLSLIYASWGYSGPEDEQLALENDFRIIEQKELASFLGSSHSNKLVYP